MELINETGLDALNFEAMDPAGDVFEVVAVKVGYLLAAGGQLIPSPDPVPLATEDEAFGALNEASLRWESDMAPFKPLCDVLVNATAYTPKGAERRFEGGLKVTRPERIGQMPDLPPPPQGLNPTMAPSEAAMAEWRQACERLKPPSISAAVLIHTSLTLTGPRLLRKKWFPVRVFWGVICLASLGLIRRNPWKLTRPERVERLSLRYEMSCGGQSKILSMVPAAKRVKRKHWLPGADLQQSREAVLSGAPDQPIAHVSHPGNHLGTGFTALWFLKASKVKRMPAPQVERTGTPFTASAFWRQARGKQAKGMESVGLGAVCRTWKPRAERAGTPDHPGAFGEEDFPGLPQDFDFRFWNCAPDDQQIPYPEGGEILELVNLCAPDHPAAERVNGTTQLRFELPKDRPFLVVKDGEGRFGATALKLDTVIIEPDESRVLLTYRTAITQDAALQWAVLKIQKAGEPDQIQAMRAWMEQGAVHA